MNMAQQKTINLPKTLLSFITKFYTVLLPYFSDYKMHFLAPKLWEENGGVSYSPNVAYLVSGGGGVFILLNILPHFLLQRFFFLFSSSKTLVHLMVQKIQYLDMYIFYISDHTLGTCSTILKDYQKGCCIIRVM